jgi:uncharacterized protein YxeA
MEQRKFNVKIIIFTITITTIVIGGGAYLWQKNQTPRSKQEIKTSAVTVSTKEESVGGGAYLWQKNQTPRSKQEIKNSAVTVSTKEESESISILNIGGLSFKLPQDWLLENITTGQNKKSNWEVAKIKVPDPKYHVILPMRILISDHEIYQADTFLLRETPSGAKIYDNFCAPAIACYYLVYNGKTYDITFEVVESNEQAPDNLDGIWFPDTTVTKNETLDFLNTVE